METCSSIVDGASLLLDDFAKNFLLTASPYLLALARNDNLKPSRPSEDFGFLFEDLLELFKDLSFEDLEFLLLKDEEDRDETDATSLKSIDSHFFKRLDGDDALEER